MKYIEEVEMINDNLKQEQENSKQLREQISMMKKRIKHLQMMDKNLRKTDDQLLKIQAKLSEQPVEDVIDEVEQLRRTMNEMQDAEKIYEQAQEECRELREAFENELSMTRSLKIEVEKLKKSHRNQIEIERCVEDSTFKFDEIQHQFETERRKSEKLKLKLEEFGEQLKKFDETESMLDVCLVRLKESSETIEELKTEQEKLETQLEEAKEKVEQYKEELEEERLNVASTKQKQIVESRVSLKLKEELTKLKTSFNKEKQLMEQQIASLTANNRLYEESNQDSKNEEEMNLRRQISALQTRLDDSEARNVELEMKNRDMKADAELAKSRLAQSAGKLKELVSSGFNEQLAIVKCDEYAEKIKELEIVNEKLRNEMKSSSLNNCNNIKMQLATNSINKNEDENTPLKPPSKTSIRHVVLRKSSPADQKQLTRTLSSKSIKTKSSSVSRLSKQKSQEMISMQDTGRPPSRAKITSPKSENHQQRSRSIIRGRVKSPASEKNEAVTKPPTSSQRSKSKNRNKSLTRVANFIKPSSSNEADKTSKTKQEQITEKKTTTKTTSTGIPKLRSTTPTLLPANKKKFTRSIKR